MIDVKTLAVFEASFAVEVDLSSNPNSQLSSSAAESESDDELDPDHLTALKLSLFEFRDEQRTWPELHPIIECFLEPNSENSKKQGKFPGCYLDNHDNCLYYHDSNNLDTGPLLVVPSTLQSQFMYAHHNAPLSGGHRGRDSTLSCLRRKYFWPGMVRDVHKWVKKCIACVKRKASQVKQGLVQIRTYAQPLDNVGIDLIGPFPETTTGYKYVLTVTVFSAITQLLPR